MAQALVAEFRGPMGSPHPIEEITLVPAAKGMYEITVDDKLIYSKLKTGQHISDEDALRLIRAAQPGSAPLVQQ